MRLVCLCLVVLLSITVAGCIGDGDAPAPDLRVVEESAVQKEYRLQLEGAAGDWVFVYLPYVNATGDIEGTNEWSLRTTPTDPEPHHVLWMAPTWVWEDRGRADFFAWGGHGPHRIESGAFESEYGSSWGLGSSEPPMGYNFAFASDAPWTLDIHLELTSGVDSFGEVLVARGSGTAATLLDAGPLSVNPVGVYDHTGTFATPGWQFVAILGEHVQPLAVRDYTYEVPGHELTRTGHRYGAQAVMGFASSSNMAGGLGVFDGSAGDWRVALTYAEAAWDRPAIVFEMPGDPALPEWTELSFWVRDEPFHDGPLPSLPPGVEDVWFTPE